MAFGSSLSDARGGEYRHGWSLGATAIQALILTPACAMTKDLDDKSRVHLSLAQFWSIMAAVAAATFVVSGNLNAIRGEQIAVRSEISAHRERNDTQIIGIMQALREMKNDRLDSMKEWAVWRSQVDQANSRRDAEIHQLKSDRMMMARPN